MKRPLALLGFSAFGALVLAALLGGEAVLPAMAVCAGLGILALLGGFYLRKKLSASSGERAFFTRLVSLALACLTAAVCLGHYGIAWRLRVWPAQALAGRELTLRAEVLDFPEQRYHRSYYRLRTQEGNTLLLSTSTPFACQPGDLVECKARCSLPNSDGGLYSTRNTRLAQGVEVFAFLTDYASVTVIPATGLTPEAFFARLRHRAARGLERLLPTDEAGLLRTLLLGERWRLSEEISGSFRAAGVSHLLAISGLHVAALAGLFAALFRRLPISRLLSRILLAALLLTFLALIGFPASAARSGLMFLLYLAAGSLGRAADGLNSLGFAVLVICLVHPFSGGDLGLALSVFATLGVLLWARPLSALLERRLPAAVASSLGMSVGAVLGTLPIQLLVFRGISLLGPLATLLLMLPCTLLLYLGVFVLAFGQAPLLAPLAQLLALLCGWLARLCIWTARMLARLPGFFVDLSQPRALVALAAVLLLLAVAILLRREPRAVAFVLSLAILLSGWARGLESFSRRDTLAFAAAAESGCVLLLKDGRAAVLALGGYRTGAALELLRRRNVRSISLLCLPVRDGEARAAAISLLRAFPVEALALPAGCYVGGDLTAALGNAALLSWADGETRTVLGASVTPEEGMARLRVETCGCTAVVERGGSGGGPCDLLFSDGSGPGCDCAFTVLQNDAIIGVAGVRGITPGGSGLYADVLPDGSLRFWGESYAAS